MKAGEEFDITPYGTEAQANRIKKVMPLAMSLTGRQQLNLGLEVGVKTKDSIGSILSEREG